MKDTITGGGQHYSEYLLTLTAEERKEHLKDRKDRKDQRKLEQILRDSIEEHADSIAFNAMRHINALLSKDDLDTAELKLITDRFLGSPRQSVDVSAKVSTIPAVSFSIQSDDPEGDKE